MALLLGLLERQAGTSGQRQWSTAACLTTTADLGRGITDDWSQWGVWLRSSLVLKVCETVCLRCVSVWSLLVLLRWADVSHLCCLILVSFPAWIFLRLFFLFWKSLLLSLSPRNLQIAGQVRAYRRGHLPPPPWRRARALPGGCHSLLVVHVEEMKEASVSPSASYIFWPGVCLTPLHLPKLHPTHWLGLAGCLPVPPQGYYPHPQPTMQSLH